MPVTEETIANTVVYIGPILLLQLNIFSQGSVGSRFELFMSDIVFSLSLLSIFAALIHMYHSYKFKTTVMPRIPLVLVGIGYLFFTFLYVASSFPNDKTSYKRELNSFIMRMFTMAITLFVAFFIFNNSKRIHFKK